MLHAVDLDGRLALVARLLLQDQDEDSHSGCWISTWLYWCTRLVANSSGLV